LDWDVKIPETLPAGFTEAQATAQAEFLRTAYDRIENLPQAFEHLALATFRGYSHLEPQHEENRRSLPVVRFEPVPQWHWFRDHETWRWRYDPNARDDQSQSTEIEPADFIIREIDDPVNEIALLSFVRANMSKKD